MKNRKIVLSILGLFLFLLLSYFIYLNLKSTIITRGDMWVQYSLFSNYTNSIFPNIFGISWQSGLGEDIIRSFSYYGLTDPFILFFKPFNLSVDTLIFLSTCLKYLVAFFFSFIWLNINSKSKLDALGGSIVFTLSLWFLQHALSFVTLSSIHPLIPLIFIGIDYIYMGKKGYVFYFLLVLASLVNFYQLLPTIFVSFIYVIYKQIKVKEIDYKFILSYIIISISSLLTASIILMPNLILILTSTKSSNIVFKDQLVSSITSFQDFISLYIASQSNLLGTSFIVILIVILTTIKNYRKIHNTFLLVSILVIFYNNFFGYLFSGFLYYTYRWAFILVALIALLFCNSLKEYRSKIFKISLISVVLIFLLKMNIEHYSHNKNFMLKKTEVDSYIENHDYRLINYIKEIDTDFYRVNNFAKNDDLRHNSPIYMNYNGLTSYSSTINENTISFFSDYLYTPKQSSRYDIGNYDQHLSLTTYLSTKYFIAKNGEYKPYGYTKHNKKGFLLENDFYLPIVFGYDTYLLSDEVDTLRSDQREKLLLETAILSNDVNLEKFTKDIPYNTIEVLKDISLDTTDLSDNYLRIDLSEYNISGEVFAELNIETDCKKSYVVEFNTSGTHSISHNTSICGNTAFSSQPYVTFGLGYMDKMDKASILFYDGKYKINSLRLHVYPIDSYTDSVNERKKYTLSNLSVSNNTVNGFSEFDKPIMLNYSIPFSNGWKAYIDGQEVKKYKINNSFIGVLVPEGKHQITLKYRTPGLLSGIVMSILGIITFIIYIIKKQ